MPATGVHVLSISGEGTTFRQELSDQESDTGPVVSTTDFNGTTEATVKHLSDDNLTRYFLKFNPIHTGIECHTYS